MGACTSCASSMPKFDDEPPKAAGSSRRRRREEDKKGRLGGGLFDGSAASVGPAGGVAGEDELRRVSVRMLSNGSSDVASLFTQQGKKGANQDAMIVWENFMSRSDTVFCGVFDGHGPYGHIVARKVRDTLPSKLCSIWEARSDVQSHQHRIRDVPESEVMAPASADDNQRRELGQLADADENGRIPEKFIILKESLLKACKLMDKDLKSHPLVDCFCSGTTAVALVKQGSDILIGNVGDSRAVLGMRDEDDNLVAVQLTVDMKPNLPSEATRIRQCRGRIFAMQDEPDVARIWLPNNDSPGLAMARAFGDFCLKDYGLISVPEFSYRRITHKDKFIVLATDGVWDVLTNEEAVEVVASAPTPAAAARALVQSAGQAWELKFPTSKADDCAAVCLFFEAESSSPSPPPDDKNQLHPAAAAEAVGDREEEGWSALEGVTRANSLVSLPRFSSSPGDRVIQH